MLKPMNQAPWDAVGELFYSRTTPTTLNPMADTTGSRDDAADTGTSTAEQNDLDASLILLALSGRAACHGPKAVPKTEL
jgi:hypothetical protein